jgi:4,5-DOPA dioxygenase extradiol
MPIPVGCCTLFVYRCTMNPESLPTIFLSHGSPITAVEKSPALAFWKKLGEATSEAGAVLCISAHWETWGPEVTCALEYETIHDFYGFPAPLYQLQYGARGNAELAERVAGLIEQAGFSCGRDRRRGLDHGAWVPLRSMYPQADIPVVQLSIQGHLDPASHLSLGSALQGLRQEGVLVLGSGGAVHPLGYAGRRRTDALVDDWAVAFERWLVGVLERGDRESLVRYRALAPFPERAHPRPDHFMPLLVALAAAGPAAKGRAIHQSWAPGDMSMAVFEFSE